VIEREVQKPPRRHITYMDFVILMLSCMAAAVVSAPFVRGHMNSTESTRTEIMQFGDATIGTREVQCVDTVTTAKRPADVAVSSWSGIGCMKRTILIETTLKTTSDTFSTGPDLAPYLTTILEPFTFRSLAEGTLLDLCGNIGVMIDANYIAPDNTCTHHAMELWCGSFRLSTADASCSPLLQQQR
jgi:hypothetical protein